MDTVAIYSLLIVLPAKTPKEKNNYIMYYLLREWSSQSFQNANVHRNLEHWQSLQIPTNTAVIEKSSEPSIPSRVLICNQVKSYSSKLRSCLRDKSSTQSGKANNKSAMKNA
jgi:hypothetical protein